MARVVVEVMPKPEILDPQGKAIVGGLTRLGFTGFGDVRQGKRFELEVEGEPTDEVLAQARHHPVPDDPLGDRAPVDEHLRAHVHGPVLDLDVTSARTRVKPPMKCSPRLAKPRRSSCRIP